MVNSREKGKRGEREFRDFLVDRGHEARRGQQYQGGTDSPDVVTSLDEHWHIEVKRVESLRLYPSLAQAKGDARPGQLPVVMHRASHKPWVAVMLAEDLLRLIERLDAHGK